MVVPARGVADEVRAQDRLPDSKKTDRPINAAAKMWGTGHNSRKRAGRGCLQISILRNAPDCAQPAVLSVYNRHNSPWRGSWSQAPIEASPIPEGPWRQPVSCRIDGEQRQPFPGMHCLHDTPCSSHKGDFKLNQESALAQRLSAFFAVSSVDRVALVKSKLRRRSFPAGSEVIHESQKCAVVLLLVEGWTCSFKILPDGSRQIVDFQIPGDCVGLRNVLFQASDHSVEAITPISAVEVLGSDILGALSEAPRLGTALLWASSRDQATIIEHLVDIGRRTAEQRIAHFLLELGARLKLAGLSDDTGYACPLTQYHLADMLGLSAVHVNRVLRHLREEGLVTFQKGRVSFDDLDRLKEKASFDGAYLDQDGAQRH